MRYDLVIFDFQGTLVDSASRLLPNAAEVLRDLAEAGITLGIVGPIDERVVREALGPAQHLLDAYACRTPLPERWQIIALIARRMEAPLERLLYVGDEAADVEAARSACVASAAVSWGVDDRATLVAADPTMLVESFDELARRITNRPLLRLAT